MKTLTLLTTLLILAASSSTASAQKLGALEIDVKANKNVVDAVNQAVARAASGGKWSFVDAATMRAKTPAGARNCYTSSCLKQVGESTKADGGLRVRMSSEAEIYDWTIDVYDLHSGKLASSKKGACELCGLAEVKTEFEASTRAAVATANISTKKIAKPKPRPEPEPQPEPIAEPTPQPEPDPINEPLPPLKSATAGLVMVEIVATPDDTIISMGGQELGRGAVTISVEHGSYEIAFRREGYSGLNEKLVVGPESSTKALLRVHLAKTDPDSVMMAGEGPLDRLGTKRKMYGIVGLATGGVLIGTGLVLSAIDGNPTCGQGAACPRVFETSAWSFMTTLSGAIIATGGAVLLGWEVLSGRESAPQRARVVPMVGPDSAGVGIVGRF